LVTSSSNFLKARVRHLSGQLYTQFYFTPKADILFLKSYIMPIRASVASIIILLPPTPILLFMVSSVAAVGPYGANAGAFTLNLTGRRAIATATLAFAAPVIP
jgi:hypothetical protein